MKAIQYHWEAIQKTVQQLFKGKFLLYFIPGAVIGFFYLMYYLQAQKLSETLDGVNAVPLIGGLLDSTIDGIGSIFSFVIDEFYKFLILVCLSPFNCLLSEKFDTELTGTKYEMSVLRIINDIFRMMLILILALLFEYTFFALWWFLTWVIPFDEYLTPIVHFSISSFFLGFAFFDYSLERHQVGTFSSWGFAFTKMSYMIVCGGIFTLLFKIPVLGIIVAPVLLTMISTYVYLRMHGKHTSKIAQ